MTADDVERDVQRAAARWAFIRSVDTVDKTHDTVKIRLWIDADCFVQVYVNVKKQLVSYALVLYRARIFGRDCEGGTWHRHPAGTPDQHDFSPDGQRPVLLSDFLAEALQVLQDLDLA